MRSSSQTVLNKNKQNIVHVIDQKGTIKKDMNIRDALPQPGDELVYGGTMGVENNNHLDGPTP